MNVLVKWNLDCGRMGELGGLFVAEEEALKAAHGKTAYFSDCLGKHSEVSFSILPGSYSIASVDQPFIEKLIQVAGSENVSGYNFLDYAD